VLASQRQPVAKKNTSNPLQRDGQELVANVARVVTATQPMVFYYEVYDPGKPPRPSRLRAAAARADLDDAPSAQRQRAR